MSTAAQNSSGEIEQMLVQAGLHWRETLGPALEKAVLHLSDEEQLLVHLAFYQEASLEEIAGLLDFSGDASAVETRLQQCLKQLAGVLSEMLPAPLSETHVRAFLKQAHYDWQRELAVPLGEAEEARATEALRRAPATVGSERAAWLEISFVAHAREAFETWAKESTEAIREILDAFMMGLQAAHMRPVPVSAYGTPKRIRVRGTVVRPSKEHEDSLETLVSGNAVSFQGISKDMRVGYDPATDALWVGHLVNEEEEGITDFSVIIVQEEEIVWRSRRREGAVVLIPMARLQQAFREGAQIIIEVYG